MPTASVIWSYEDGPRPDPPYIAMKLTDVRTIGHDWTTREDAEAPAPGAEVLFRHRGARIVALELQCFTVKAGGAGGAGGILSDAVAALAVHVNALDLAGIGIGNIGPIRALDSRRGSLFEPRAVVEIDLHLASELESYSGYIEHVQLAVEVATLLETEIWLPDAPAP